MLGPQDRLLPSLADVLTDLCHVQGAVLQVEKKLGPDTVATGIRALHKLEGSSKVADLDQEVFEHERSAAGGRLT